MSCGCGCAGKGNCGGGRTRGTNANAGGLERLGVWGNWSDAATRSPDGAQQAVTYRDDSAPADNPSSSAPPITVLGFPPLVAALRDLARGFMGSGS